MENVMSLGFFQALLATILFMALKIAMDIGLAFLPGVYRSTGVPGDYYKLILAAGFFIPYLPFLAFVYFRNWARPTREPRPFLFIVKDTASPVARELRPDYWRRPVGWIVLFLALPLSLQVAGSEIEKIVMAVFPCDDTYLRMMEVLRPTGHIADLAGAYLTIGILSPLSEELFFRGFLLGALFKGHSGRARHGAIWFQGILFGLSHLNRLQIPYAIPMGILFGYLRLWGGGILPSVIVHAVNNLMAVVLIYHMPWESVLNPEDCASIEHVPFYLLTMALALLLVSSLHIRNNSIPRRGGPLESGHGASLAEMPAGSPPGNE